MQTLIKLFVYLSVLVIAGYIMLLVLSKIDTSGITDKYNPLVEEKQSYVKTSKAVSKQDAYIRNYSSNGYDMNGNKSRINYTATYDLKLNRYLKINHKGRHVESFEEVDKKEIPKNVLNKIESDN